MTSGANKGIPTNGIIYNQLNLPTSVTLAGGTISYIYDATGVKEKKIVPGKETQYAGNFIYEGGTLQFFSTPEGYVSYDGGQFNYVYNYVDHLGSVRLSYTDANGNGSIDPSSEIIQEKNYYTFGLTHEGYNIVNNGLGNVAAKWFKFGGKELQDENISGNSLDWYDVSERNYDPALGRWMNIDPLAEEFYKWSPYNYTYNNPLNFIDPTGMGPTDWYKNLETGDVEWFDGSYEIEGYEHLGYTVGETNVDNNRALYDGNTKSEYYNGEFVKSHENEESLFSFVSSNFLGQIVSFSEKGTQSLVNGFQGAGYGLFKSFYEDVDGMDFGEDFFLMDFKSDTTYNNGKWINVDPMSMGEKQYAKDFGVDATSSLLNFVGLPRFLKSGNRVLDNISSFVRDSFIVNSLENILED